MSEASQTAIRAPSLKRQKLALWAAFLIILAVSPLSFLSIQQRTFG